MLTRRSLITSIPFIACAPAIVRAESLMKVKPIRWSIRVDGDPLWLSPTGTLLVSDYASPDQLLIIDEVRNRVMEKLSVSRSILAGAR